MLTGISFHICGPTISKECFKISEWRLIYCPMVVCKPGIIIVDIFVFKRVPTKQSGTSIEFSFVYMNIEMTYVLPVSFRIPSLSIREGVRVYY